MKRYLANKLHAWNRLIIHNNHQPFTIKMSYSIYFDLPLFYTLYEPWVSLAEAYAIYLVCHKWIIGYCGAIQLSLDARPILKYRSGNKRSNGDLCLKTHSKFILTVLRHFWLIHSKCLKTLRMNLECVLRRFRVTVLRRLTNYSKCLKTVW